MAPFLRVPAGIRYRVEGELLLLLQEQHKPDTQRSEIGGGRGQLSCVARLSSVWLKHWQFVGAIKRNRLLLKSGERRS